MELKRNLKYGMSGEDVKKIKEMLFDLGYYSNNITKITHDVFGRDTEYAVETFQDVHDLAVDGIVGPETFDKLVALTEAPQTSIEFTRNIKLGTSGVDVLEVKRKLFELGYYTSNITKITNNQFGRDTLKAVKVFQGEHDLEVDGIVGIKTWSKLMSTVKSDEEIITIDYITVDKYPRLSEKVIKAVNEALSNNVSEIRRKVVMEALKYATDASIASKFEYPSSLYIRGGNLYNANDELNVISEKYLTGAYVDRYESYCTNGRLEMMQEAVKNNPEITGADCSGGIIGIFRHFELIGMKEDTTANSLCGSSYSTIIGKANLKPGDFIGKSGHICLFVGGNYMVEWAGGEYGCQVSEVSDRKCWSFTKKKLVTLSACTKYRKPKAY